jgi:hypothetical protein
MLRNYIAIPVPTSPRKADMNSQNVVDPDFDLMFSRRGNLVVGSCRSSGRPGIALQNSKNWIADFPGQ